MSEEIAIANANLIEIAQLRAQLTARTLRISELQSELTAARADMAALIDGINQYARASPEERGPLYTRLFALMIADSPGAALLAELETARAVVDAAREWREAVEQLNGVYAAEQALVAALKASEG